MACILTTKRDIATATNHKQAWCCWPDVNLIMHTLARLPPAALYCAHTMRLGKSVRSALTESAAQNSGLRQYAHPCRMSMSTSADLGIYSAQWQRSLLQVGLDSSKAKDEMAMFAETYFGQFKKTPRGMMRSVRPCCWPIDCPASIQLAHPITFVKEQLTSCISFPRHACGVLVYCIVLHAHVTFS